MESNEAPFKKKKGNESAPGKTSCCICRIISLNKESS